MTVVEAPDVSLQDMISTVVEDMDPQLAAAFSSAMAATYRLGGAVMRRQLIEALMEHHAKAELHILEVKLEGVAASH